MECWVTWCGVLGCMVEGVRLHRGMLGYMMESVGLHGGEH